MASKDLLLIENAAQPTPGQGLSLDLKGVIPSGAFPRYLPYTPTWVASGTAVAIGDAVVTGRYVQIGKFVHCYGAIVFGASSTYGTGTYTFALPVAASANALMVGIAGSAVVFDSSAGAVGTVVAQVTTTTTMRILYGATYLGASTVVAQTAPWTWAQSDSISWNIAYEAA